MKYLIIGAGGTGGSIAGFMAEAGKDVTVIARGRHLEAILKNGMKMETTAKGNFTVFPMKACNMEHYSEDPDVIFVCVKGYSLDETIPFIRQIARPDTIVIPLLNIYGTGGKMQEQLPDLLVTDGCMYISAEIKEPGVILQSGDIFRIVFGVRNPEEYNPVLELVAKDLSDSSIRCIVSNDIKRDAMQKFSYISPMAACGAYYDVPAGPVQQGGKERETFIALQHEILELAEAMGIRFTVDIIKTNLAILDAIQAGATTSLQRDLKKGKASEIDGLIFEVVRLGKKFGVPVPTYQMIAAHFGFRD